MTTKRMLIDAAHPEETRVAVVEGDRLVDFDVEVSSRRQLKGNIYLAKVTRVEPSLQAAFVDYGGNRHGFLAFNEIHPDYYQIPVADREALLAEQAAAEHAEDAATEERREKDGEDGAAEDIEDEIEVRRPRISTRHYKIQEVIKRRQIMLVQVAKEERGTKGAALTTYLSLAGRYCVLMPNTTRGGGISRKITNATDRKRLKKIIGELGVPEGMAVILRTAGSERSKAEIRRDYDYLMRLWSSIRELTLTSMAPALVYEEGSLIKRSIRDLYDRLIEEILIEGEQAYRTAKDFMKLFIPSHARRVKLYEDKNRPLFQSFSVESELEAMHQPLVHLKSGGSIVINPTEALVAIDVNSGRSTRERHIEETALRTNIEACDEVARQLRLRDLAGLIVVDFIDMENQRNQGQVERRFKEAMKSDRARIQLGRISVFGLMELSRQRLRPSLFETSFEACPHCAGLGIQRTTESLALAVLRSIEQHALAETMSEINARVSLPVAQYLLNQKRRILTDLESRFSVSITIASDESLMASQFEIECSGRPPSSGESVAETETGAEQEAAAEPEAEDRGDEGKKGRRRRPRRRKRSNGDQEAISDEGRDAWAETATAASETAEEGDAGPEGDGEPEGEPDAEGEGGEDDADKAQKKRRRRGKRGGRRRARKPSDEDAGADEDLAAEAERFEVPIQAGLAPDPLLEGVSLESADWGETEQPSSEPHEWMIGEQSEPSEPGEQIEQAETSEAVDADVFAEAGASASDDEETASEPGAEQPFVAPEVIFAPPPEDIPSEGLHRSQPDQDVADDEDLAAGDNANENRESNMAATEPEEASESIEEVSEDHEDGADEPQSGEVAVDTSEERASDTFFDEERTPDHTEEEVARGDVEENDNKETERAEMSRTVVINVGTDRGQTPEGGRRKGWWQRFIS